MSTSARLDRAYWTATLLFVGMFFPVIAFAQDATPCPQVIDLAERYYEQNRMEEVIAIVADCLSDEATDQATAVRGYRLLALAYLRSDQLPEAKLAVIELLGRDPSYTTDPVEDLPAYTALVNNIKVQLALQGVQAQPAEDTTATPVNQPVDNAQPANPDDAGAVDGYRPQDRILLGQEPRSEKGVSLRARFGWSSYGGERGNSGNGFFDEFADNGGVNAAAEIGFVLTDVFTVGFQYALGHYDNMLAPKGSPPEFPTIVPGDSSPWLHYLGLFGRGYAPTGGIVRPYAQVGYLATFGLLNNKVSVGSGPRFGIGVDFAVDDNVGLFAEVDAQIVLPGTASDLVDRDFGYDLFAGSGVGLRYRISQ